jgi:hypothetical protein
VSIPSFFPIQSNAKSPDVPGAVDITMGSANVSPCFSMRAERTDRSQNTSWPGKAVPGDGALPRANVRAVHPLLGPRKNPWMPGLKPGMTSLNGLRLA